MAPSDWLPVRSLQLNYFVIKSFNATTDADFTWLSLIVRLYVPDTEVLQQRSAGGSDLPAGGGGIGDVLPLNLVPLAKNYSNAECK